MSITLCLLFIKNITDLYRMKLSRNKIAKLLKSGNQSRKNIKKRRSKTLHNAHLLSSDEIILAPDKEVKRRARSAHLHPRPLNLRFKTLKNRVKGWKGEGGVLDENQKAQLAGLKAKGVLSPEDTVIFDELIKKERVGPELPPRNVSGEPLYDVKTGPAAMNQPNYAVPVRHVGESQESVANPIYDIFQVNKDGIVEKEVALPKGTTKVSLPTGADYRPPPTNIKPDEDVYAQIGGPEYVLLTAQTKDNHHYELLAGDTLTKVQQQPGFAGQELTFIVKPKGSEEPIYENLGANEQQKLLSFFRRILKGDLYYLIDVDNIGKLVTFMLDDRDTYKELIDFRDDDAEELSGEGKEDQEGGGLFDSFSKKYEKEIGEVRAMLDGESIKVDASGNVVNPESLQKAINEAKIIMTEDKWRWRWSKAEEIAKKYKDIAKKLMIPVLEDYFRKYLQWIRDVKAKKGSPDIIQSLINNPPSKPPSASNSGILKSVDRVKILGFKNALLAIEATIDSPKVEQIPKIRKQLRRVFKDSNLPDNNGNITRRLQNINSLQKINYFYQKMSIYDFVENKENKWFKTKINSGSSKPKISERDITKFKVAKASLKDLTKVYIDFSGNIIKNDSNDMKLEYLFYRIGKQLHPVDATNITKTTIYNDITKIERVLSSSFADKELELFKSYEQELFSDTSLSDMKYKTAKGSVLNNFIIKPFVFDSIAQIIRITTRQIIPMWQAKGTQDKNKTTADADKEKKNATEALQNAKKEQAEKYTKAAEDIVKSAEVIVRYAGESTEEEPVVAENVAVVNEPEVLPNPQGNTAGPTAGPNKPEKQGESLDTSGQPEGLTTGQNAGGIEHQEEIKAELKKIREARAILNADNQDQDEDEASADNAADNTAAQPAAQPLYGNINNPNNPGGGGTPDEDIKAAKKEVDDALKTNVELKIQLKKFDKSLKEINDIVQNQSQSGGTKEEDDKIIEQIETALKDATKTTYADIKAVIDPLIVKLTDKEVQKAFDTLKGLPDETPIADYKAKATEAIAAAKAAVAPVVENPAADEAAAEAEKEKETASEKEKKEALATDTTTDPAAVVPKGPGLKGQSPSSIKTSAAALLAESKTLSEKVLSAMGPFLGPAKASVAPIAAALSTGLGRGAYNDADLREQVRKLQEEVAKFANKDKESDEDAAIRAILNDENPQRFIFDVKIPKDYIYKKKGPGGTSTENAVIALKDDVYENSIRETKADRLQSVKQYLETIDKLKAENEKYMANDKKTKEDQSAFKTKEDQAKARFIELEKKIKEHDDKLLKLEAEKGKGNGPTAGPNAAGQPTTVGQNTLGITVAGKPTPVGSTNPADLNPTDPKAAVPQAPVGSTGQQPPADPKAAGPQAPGAQPADAKAALTAVIALADTALDNSNNLEKDTTPEKIEMASTSLKAALDSFTTAIANMELVKTKLVENKAQLQEILTKIISAFKNKHTFNPDSTATTAPHSVAIEILDKELASFNGLNDENNLKKSLKIIIDTIKKSIGEDSKEKNTSAPAAPAGGNKLNYGLSKKYKSLSKHNNKHSNHKHTLKRNFKQRGGVCPDPNDPTCPPSDTASPVVASVPPAEQVDTPPTNEQVVTPPTEQGAPPPGPDAPPPEPGALPTNEPGAPPPEPGAPPPEPDAPPPGPGAVLPGPGAPPGPDAPPPGPGAVLPGPGAAPSEPSAPPAELTLAQLQAMSAPVINIADKAIVAPVSDSAQETPAAEGDKPAEPVPGAVPAAEGDKPAEPVPPAGPDATAAVPGAVPVAEGDKPAGPVPPAGPAAPAATEGAAAADKPAEAAAPAATEGTDVKKGGSKTRRHKRTRHRKSKSKKSKKRKSKRKGAKLL
jgi:hypothetical protein